VEAVGLIHRDFGAHSPVAQRHCSRHASRPNPRMSRYRARIPGQVVAALRPA
jgi:hypothetical protein